MKTLNPQARQALDKAGVPVYPWDPREIDAVKRGQRTFGELLGVPKQRQHELAAMGLKLLQDGLRDKAKQIFEGLQALDPYDAYVETCLGSIALEDEDVAAAEAHFNRALELNPASAPAHLLRGELRVTQGRKAEAIADLAAAKKTTVAGNHEVSARAAVLLEALKNSK